MRRDEMGTQSIYFNKFILFNKYSVQDIAEILNGASNSSEKFVVNDYGNNYIDGMYITSQVLKETIFDVDKMIYESIDVIRNVAINFFIDMERNVIEIWGNKNNSQKLLTRVAILFDNKITLESFKITMPVIIKRLKKNNLSIGKVKIEDVVLQDNIIATCAFGLTNYEKPYEILGKYKDKITQISVSLKEENNTSMTLSIYSSGSVIVYRAKEDISESNLSIIKEICIGGD